jgi:hypothetical protein
MAPDASAQAAQAQAQAQAPRAQAQASKDKVHRLNPNHSMPSSPGVPEDALTKPYRDMGRVALFVSLLTVVLMVVFVFGFNQNISGLNDEIKSLGTLRTDMQGVSAKMDALEAKVAEFDALPAKAKRMVFAGMLQDMAQRAGAMSIEVGDEAAVDKLNQARGLLLEVYEQMNRP